MRFPHLQIYDVGATDLNYTQVVLLARGSPLFKLVSVSFKREAYRSGEPAQGQVTAEFFQVAVRAFLGAREFAPVEGRSYYMRGVVGAGAASWGGSETDHGLELHSGRRWNSGPAYGGAPRAT